MRIARCFLSGAVLVVAVLLAGCGSITVPAAVKTSRGETLIGTTTAALSGGTFDVSGPGLRCAGNYDALDTRPTISVPFHCSDGRTGLLTVTRTSDGQAGSGTAQMSDGTTARVAFGRLSSTVLQPAYPPAPAQTGQAPVGLYSPQPASAGPSVPIRGPVSGSCDCPYDYKSNGSLCGGTSAWSRPGGRSPECYKTSAAAPAVDTVAAPSCAENGSCYGDISTTTGNPKTVHVGGYYRKDGTYVRGHYRSRPRW